MRMRRKTKLALYNSAQYGWILGEPISYINGHQARSKLSVAERFGEKLISLLD
jgi:hypothetical protein